MDDWDILDVLNRFEHELISLGFSYDGANRYVDGFKHGFADEQAKREAITFALWDYDLMWILEQARREAEPAWSRGLRWERRAWAAGETTVVAA